MTVEHTTRILGRDQAYFRRAKACFVQSREVFPHKFRRIGYARSEIVGARDYLLKSYCAHRRDDGMLAVHQSTVAIEDREADRKGFGHRLLFGRLDSQRNRDGEAGTIILAPKAERPRAAGLPRVAGRPQGPRRPGVRHTQ